MPPLGGVAENYNIGAQFHHWFHLPLKYRMVVRVIGYRTAYGLVEGEAVFHGLTDTITDVNTAAL